MNVCVYCARKEEVYYLPDFLIVRLKTRRVTGDLLPVKMNFMWEKRQRDAALAADTERGYRTVHFLPEGLDDGS